MRLIVGRVFDEFPKLKIVLGHMGEALPYWLYRIDYMYKNATIIYSNASGHRLKKLQEYSKDNFLITTSGMNTHPVLQYCHSSSGSGQHHVRGRLPVSRIDGSGAVHEFRATA